MADRIKEPEKWQSDLFGSQFKGASDADRSTRSEQAERLRTLAKSEMVRVAPEEYAWVPRDDCEPGKLVMCRWVKGRDDKYRPVPMGGRFVRLCPAVAAELGFRHLDRRVRYETIMRLWRAEMIEMVQISPQCYLLDLESWFRHLAECADDPEMWEPGGEARAEYRYKNGMG